MRMLGLVLVTSLAVGYLAHTPARAPECDATAVGSTAGATADLPIYYGGTLAPVVVVGELEPATSARVAGAGAAGGARSAVLN
jgi:hypothetical protein